jgi:hypothetical protein
VFIRMPLQLLQEGSGKATDFEELIVEVYSL